MSLLEKAKEMPLKVVLPKEITGEHIKLAIAWAKNEITYRQVAFALGKMKNRKYQPHNVVYWLARCFKQAVRKGILKE